MLLALATGLLGGLLVPGAAGATGAAPAASDGAVAQTWYVSSRTGSDTAAGTSPATAWRTLRRAASVTLAPGDQLLLERGSRFAGGIAVTASGEAGAPVTLASYGTGARPRLGGACVEVGGSWVTVAGLRATGCRWAGFTLRGDHDRLEDSVADHDVAGVHVAAAAEYAVVVNNDLSGNQRMAVNTPGGDDDAGAWGVLVDGDHAEVAWNRIDRNHAASYDHGQDGAAVEVRSAVGTRVHHNVALGDLRFVELGGSGTGDTVLEYNLVVSSVADARFVVVPGSDGPDGPALGTVVRHNTAVLDGAGAQGFVCLPGCSGDVLTLSGNVVVARARVGRADAAYAGGGNLFWGGRRSFPLAPDDRVAPPQFVDRAHRDLHLGPLSPGIDRDGSLPGLDAYGVAVPQDGDGDGVAAADLGALES